eukprot:1161909-Pelagomonas_calceolata.AAC.22
MSGNARFVSRDESHICVEFVCIHMKRDDVSCCMEFFAWTVVLLQQKKKEVCASQVSLRALREGSLGQAS